MTEIRDGYLVTDEVEVKYLLADSIPTTQWLVNGAIVAFSRSQVREAIKAKKGEKGFWVPNCYGNEASPIFIVYVDNTVRETGFVVAASALTMNTCGWLRKLWAFAMAKTITVCDKCFRASCWQGLFMCDEAQTAGTVEMTPEELREKDLEHPSHWAQEADDE